MTDNARNGHVSAARPRRIDLEEHWAPKSRFNAIEGVKERIVDFVSQKPGTAVVAGVILGAALALLVGRRRK
jgi:hypothetical protein